MNRDSHIVLCGAISTYNDTTEYPPPISEELKNILASKNITRCAFLLYFTCIIQMELLAL